MPILLAKIKVLLILEENSWKTKKYTFPAVHYFTWKLELVSDVLWVNEERQEKLGINEQNTFQTSVRGSLLNLTQVSIETKGNASMNMNRETCALLEWILQPWLWFSNNWRNLNYTQRC